MAKEHNTSRQIKPRKAPRQERSREKVEQILTAAKQLLIDQGLEKLTTNHIAKASSMSVGSLYQYFPNKQAILYDLYQRMLEETRQLLGASGSQVNSLAELEEMMEKDIFQFWFDDSDDQKYQRELSMAMSLYPELQEMDVKHGTEVAAMVKDILIQLGAKAPESELQQLGLFIYEQYNVLETMIVDLKCDTQLAIGWYKKTVFGLMQEYIES